MKTLVKPILLNIALAFLFLVASNSAFAVTVNQQTICQNGNVPTGWVVADKTWSRTTCGSPHTPAANVWLLDEFDSLPVGAPLTVCESSAIPAGWVPTGYEWNPSVCGAQFGIRSAPYSTVSIRNALCTNEAASLCFPQPSQFALIWALPTKVLIPYGQGSGSSSIGWFALNPVCIWVSTPGVGTQLWSCAGNSAIQKWPYVNPGVSQTFIVSPSATSASPVLASVVVKGVEGMAPKITAAPSAVTVPAGKSVGSTRISYNLTGSDYASMCIWVSNNGAAAQLWACGSGVAFSQVWPYVPKGGTSVFWLNPSTTSSSQILASVLVTGQ